MPAGKNIITVGKTEEKDHTRIFGGTIASLTLEKLDSDVITVNFEEDTDDDLEELRECFEKSKNKFKNFVHCIPGRAFFENLLFLGSLLFFKDYELFSSFSMSVFS